MAASAPVTRRLRWLGLGLVLAVGVGALVWRIWFRDTATPVTVDAAVAAFRDHVESETGAAHSGPATPADEPEDDPQRAPAPGVYVYDTAGFERIDALGGATHRYPSTSTMAIRHTACGASYEWQPLEERSERLELCSSERGLSLHSYRSHHRFFGEDDVQDYTCAVPLVLIPTDPTVGMRSSTSCSSPPLVEQLTATITAVAPFSVGEVTVDAIRLRVDVVLTATDGSTTGTASADLRLARSDGLILTWSETTASVADSPIGDVSYDEEILLTLRAMEPST